MIGQRTGQQQEGGDRDQVSGQDPLQLDHACVQATAYRWDRDVDHERVEEPDHRGEDRRRYERHASRTAQREEVSLRWIGVS